MRIRVQYRYNNNYAYVDYPCTDAELDIRLSELNPDGCPDSIFVSQIATPRELAFLENTFINPDEMNYLAKRMDSFWGDEEI